MLLTDQVIPRRHIFHYQSQAVCHSGLGEEPSQWSDQIYMLTERVHTDYSMTCGRSELMIIVSGAKVEAESDVTLRFH